MLSICIVLLLSIVIEVNEYTNAIYEYSDTQKQEVQMLEQEEIEISEEIIKKIEEKEIDESYEKVKEFNQKKDDLQIIEDKKEWFATYKTLLNEYSQWVDYPESIEDEYSSDEILLLQRAVETEAYDCDFESKVNVACVILNRVEDENFSNNLVEVITVTNPKQFAYGRTEITEDTKLAVEYAYMIEDTTDGALYFHSNPKTEYFNGAKFIFKDNAGHCFYK